MVSVTEKAHSMRQVGTEKANESEPLMTCRKRSDDIETGVQLLPRDEPGGYLSTALVVSGTEVARARLVWNVGTPRPDTVDRMLGWSARGRTPSSGHCEGQSTDAGQAGGPSRSSDEAR